MAGQPPQSGLESAAGIRLSILGPLTVSQITRMVRDTLRAVLPPSVSVVGQISNWRPQSSGHAWFTLKDDKAQLSCVMWADRARRLKFKPEDGLEVVASGNIDVYPAQGRYQLYVERLEPVGVGALEIAFRQLYERLLGEGLFDESHKKPLPRFPSTIAIVTSPTGAAVRDIIRTIHSRWPAVTLLVVPVRVQGDKAAGEIVKEIRRVNELRKRFAIDVMIVGRGGGSMEDLWPFNDEAVARAIHASHIPIISAVGHERDTTIADLVADVRAFTPTHAGQLAVPVMEEVLAELDDLARDLGRRMLERLETYRLRLESVTSNAWLADPVRRLREHCDQLEKLGWRIRSAIGQQITDAVHNLTEIRLRLQRVRPDLLLVRRRTELEGLAGQLDRAIRNHRRLLASQLESQASCVRQLSPLREIRELGRRLDGLQARLEASSPQQILKRGFTITRHAGTGRFIMAAGQVQPGTRVRTETADGQFESTVAQAPQPPVAPRPARKARPEEERSGQLFLPIDPPQE